MRASSILIAVWAVVMLALFWAGVIAVTQVIDFGIADAMQSDLAAGITIFGAILGTGFIGILVARAVEDYRQGTTFSAFFWPLLAMTVVFTSLVAYIAIGSYDRLTHDGEMRWTWTRDADLLLIVRLLYLDVFLTLGWKAALVLGLSVRGAALLFAVFAAIGGLAWLLAAST